MNPIIKTAGYSISIILILIAFFFLFSTIICLSNSSIMNELASDSNYSVETMSYLLLIGTIIIVFPLLLLGLGIILFIHKHEKKKCNIHKPISQSKESTPFFLYLTYDLIEKNNRIQKNLCLLDSLIHYIIKPTYDIPVLEKTIKTKFGDVFRITSISVIIGVVLSLFISIVLGINQNPIGQHVLSDLTTINPVFLLIFLVVITPLVEEPIFRSWLRFNPKSFALSIVFLTIFIINIIYFMFQYIISFQDYIIILSISIIVESGILYFILKKSDNVDKIQQIYRTHFKSMFYFSTILFAAVHLSNYKNISHIWMLAPLLVIPQFVIGLNLGYVRMHYGLKWSILQHMIYNGIIISPVLIVISATSKNIETISIGEIILIVLSVIFFVCLAIIILVSSIHLGWEYVTNKQSTVC